MSKYGMEVMRRNEKIIKIIKEYVRNKYSWKVIQSVPNEHIHQVLIAY